MSIILTNDSISLQGRLMFHLIFQCALHWPLWCWICVNFELFSICTHQCKLPKIFTTVSSFYHWTDAKYKALSLIQYFPVLPSAGKHYCGLQSQMVSVGKQNNLINFSFRWAGGRVLNTRVKLQRYIFLFHGPITHTANRQIDYGECPEGGSNVGKAPKYQHNFTRRRMSPVKPLLAG